MLYTRKPLFRMTVFALVLVTLASLVTPVLAIAINVTGSNPPVVAPLPDVVRALDGSSASVTVSATTNSGTDLSYQWYIAEAGSSRFSKSSIKTATYSVKMNAARNGRQVYCLVSDGYGSTTKSETVTLKLGTPIKLTAQPQSVSVAAGSSARVSVTATGEGTLSYQWYIKDVGDSAFRKSSVTTKNYSVRMKPAVNGRQVYCVVSDTFGQAVTSKTATLSMNDTLVIYGQPTDSTARIGEKVSATVLAHGKGTLTYTWYVAKPGSSTFEKSVITKPTYSVVMSAARDGSRVYCVVSDSTGKKVTSNTFTISAIYELKILSQPREARAFIGSVAKTTVKASGLGLTYQWYIASATSDVFHLSPVTYNFYSITMDEDRAGRKAYCVITDKFGNQVTTNTVTFDILKPLTITQEPNDAQAFSGKIATVTTAASGEKDLTYQWYVRAPGGSKFYKSSVTGPVYTARVSDAIDGRQVYCVISDDYGQKVTTKTVTIRKAIAPIITQEPTDAKALNGRIVATTVKASGESYLTYQWYIRSPNGAKFYKSSVTGPTYSARMSDAVNGRQAYCVITDRDGNVSKTRTVTLSTPAPLVITRQPEDVKVISGKAATISVEVSGDGDFSYQWYIRNAGRKNFYKSSATFASYSPIMSDAVDGREAYCVISDSYGQSVTSKTVTLRNNPDGLHILIVGNSHSLDAFWFLPSAWMDQHPDADLCIGILYYSGGSISEHVAAANNGDPANRYYKNNDGRWVIEHGVTHEYILSDQEWDIILMQPGKDDIIDPTLNKAGRYQLAEVISRYVKNPHELVWHITWPCPNDETFYSPDYIRQPPEGYKDRLIELYDFNPINQYSEKIEMTKAHILNDPLYAKSVCTGAAVMQAHLTQGIPQLDLYRDYTHLNDFGRLMVGYALVAQMTGEPIKDVGIDVIDVRSRWYTYKDQGDLIITQSMKDAIIEASNYSLVSPWEMPKQTN